MEKTITIAVSSGSAAMSDDTTAVMTAVNGPVGSEIKVGMPPKIEAKKPISMAPYKPAVGPTPEATPNAEP